jgi:hypothetical protein
MRDEDGESTNDKIKATLYLMMPDLEALQQLCCVEKN